ncbi:hypothetical protein OF83DRAFT_1129880 [Amylostereum chailletii]|nr:hypothetical protein OF83DRAFT_1129880 [Amylostereum chailletii]
MDDLPAATSSTSCSHGSVGIVDAARWQRLELGFGNGGATTTRIEEVGPRPVSVLQNCQGERRTYQRARGPTASVPGPCRTQTQKVGREARKVSNARPRALSPCQTPSSLLLASPKTDAHKDCSTPRLEWHPLLTAMSGNDRLSRAEGAGVYDPNLGQRNSFLPPSRSSPRRRHRRPRPPSSLSPSPPHLPFAPTRTSPPEMFFDPLDFTFIASTPTPSSFLFCPSPLPDSDCFSDPDLDADIPHFLERQICTNFTCCGLDIADLHELLDHFEEAHVVVLNDDDVPPFGRPPYPSNVAFHDAKMSPFSDSWRPENGSPPSPLVLDYPRPRALPPNTRPVTPVPLLFPATFDSRYSSSSLSSPTLTEPPSPLSFPMGDFFSGTRPSSPSPQGAFPPASFSKRPSTGPMRTPKREKETERRGPGGRFKARESPSHSIAGGGKKRERHYRCPRPGCVKTYLNPNGLKYHIDKGTCKIEVTSLAASLSPAQQHASPPTQ